MNLNLNTSASKTNITKTIKVIKNSKKNLNEIIKIVKNKIELKLYYIL